MDRNIASGGAADDSFRTPAPVRIRFTLAMGIDAILSFMRRRFRRVVDAGCITIEIRRSVKRRFPPLLSPLIVTGAGIIRRGFLSVFTRGAEPVRFLCGTMVGNLPAPGAGLPDCGKMAKFFLARIWTFPGASVATVDAKIGAGTEPPTTLIVASEAAGTPTTAAGGGNGAGVGANGATAGEEYTVSVGTSRVMCVGSALPPLFRVRLVFRGAFKSAGDANTTTSFTSDILN